MPPVPSPLPPALGATLIKAWKPFSSWATALSKAWSLETTGSSLWSFLLLQLLKWSVRLLGPAQSRLLPNPPGSVPSGHLASLTPSCQEITASFHSLTLKPAQSHQPLCLHGI